MEALIAQKVQGAQHAQDSPLPHHRPQKGAEEELMAVMGGGAGVEVHRGSGFRQVVCPLGQALVLLGHPPGGSGRTGQVFLIEIREGGQVVVLIYVGHPLDGLCQHRLVLCLGLPGQGGRKALSTAGPGPGRWR